MHHQPRDYRHHIEAVGLPSFTVRVKETDLLIYAPAELKSRAKELVLEGRGQIERFIEQHPAFLHTLAPFESGGPAPDIVREMIRSGKAANVGPMAAVAGAVAQHVGRGLLALTPETIVENGGDLFICSRRETMIAVYAGDSPLSMKLGLRIPPTAAPVGVCTSSGTVGHSLSLGKADAVCVYAPSCALADAAATAIGNLVGSAADLAAAIQAGRSIEGVSGILVIVGDRLGAWGDLEVVPLPGKKGLSFPRKRRK